MFTADSNKLKLEKPYRTEFINRHTETLVKLNRDWERTDVIEETISDRVNGLARQRRRKE